MPTTSGYGQPCLTPTANLAVAGLGNVAIDLAGFFAALDLAAIELKKKKKTISCRHDVRGAMSLVAVGRVTGNNAWRWGWATRQRQHREGVALWRLWP